MFVDAKKAAWDYWPIELKVITIRKIVWGVCVCVCVLEMSPTPDEFQLPLTELQTQAGMCLLCVCAAN